MNKPVVVIVIALILPMMLIGQDCQRNLLESRRAYLNGNFMEVNRLLGSCYSQLESLADQKEAMEFLINTNLILDENEKADSLMLGLLELFPLYSTRSTDLVEFTQLFGTYEIKRRFNLSAVIGMNIPDFKVMQYRSYSSITDEPAGYNSKPGLSFGVNGEWYFLPNLYVLSGLYYQRSSYAQKETLMTFQDLYVSEDLSYLKLPVQLGAQFGIGKIDCFIQGGMSMHFLLSSKADIELFGRDPEFTHALTGLAKKTTDYDLSNQRTTTSFNYTFGLGLRRVLGLYALEISAQYEYGLNNLVETDARYRDKSLLETYAYVSDDFKMDNLQIKVGVNRFIVQPKKKEQ